MPYCFFTIESRPRNDSIRVCFTTPLIKPKAHLFTISHNKWSMWQDVIINFNRAFFIGKNHDFVPLDYHSNPSLLSYLATMTCRKRCSNSSPYLESQLPVEPFHSPHVFTSKPPLFQKTYSIPIHNMKLSIVKSVVVWFGNETILLRYILNLSIRRVYNKIDLSTIKFHFWSHLENYHLCIVYFSKSLVWYCGWGWWGGWCIFWSLKM